MGKDVEHVVRMKRKKKKTFFHIYCKAFMNLVEEFLPPVTNVCQSLTKGPVRMRNWSKQVLYKCVEEKAE